MFKIQSLKLPQLQTNVPLAPYTSFEIGGTARYFFVAKTAEDMISTMKEAHRCQIPYFILGGGTNILVSDKGFDGLVIFIKNENLDINNGLIRVGAGLSLQQLLQETQKLGFGGIEFMAGIPGSVGGAIRGNAGAYGRAIGDFGDVVKEVLVYKDGGIKKISQADMRFRYRSSIVKEQGGLIIEGILRLEPKDPVEIQAAIDKNLLYRNKKTPVNVRSAGSVFKNIEMDKIELDVKRILKALDVTPQEFQEATKYRKLPVSFINDRLGLKGKTIGKAQISTLHGGYIINLGGAKSDDVIQLIAFIKTRVRDTLGIQLEEEIQYVG